MIKSAQEVLKDIKQNKLAPIYLIHGDEPFFIDQLTESFEKNVLSPDEQSFNQFILFGKDHSMGSVVSYARRFPMMAEKQVIIVKEATFLENLGKGKAPAKDKTDDEWKAFEDYCQNPTPSTLLVFTIKNLLTDKSRILTPLVKHGIIVASKKITDDKVAQWLKDYLATAQLTMKADTLEMMVTYVGSDLKRMAFEADKLIINLPAGTEVGSAEVEKYIGISRDYNYFEFQKAVIQKNIEKAQKIAFYFADNSKQNPVAPMIVLLYNFFSKVLQVHDLGNISENEIARETGINPYFLRDYVAAKRNYSLGKVVRILEELKNADLKMKGVIGQGVSDRDIILDLSFMILH
ncbi:DNA polymerase III subunit delta [Aquirufa sp. ROCK-SH2]